jgi:DNA-binding LytR/AlgR family response regulator
MTSFFVRYNGRFEKIEFAKIRYIEASLSYCKIHTIDSLYLVPGPFKQIEASLPPEEFCRIHRSFIVAIAHIRAFDHKAVYLSDRELPVSESWFPAMLRQLPILSVAVPKPLTVTRSGRPPRTTASRRIASGRSNRS